MLFPIANGVGTLVARVNAKRREVVRRNLLRVVGDVDVEQYIDQAFRSYARYWMEALRLPKPGLDEIRKRTTIEGLEHLEKYRAEGKSVIFASAHIGSYDIAAAFLASIGWRVLAVAEDLEPPEMFDMFAGLRRAVGVEALPAGKGSTARALLTGLRDSGVAAGLICDRDITGSGIMVKFFGEETLVPNGPAVLALRTGAALVPGALYQRPGGKYHAVILDPIDVEAGKAEPDRVRALTETVVRKLEELIRREPGQWHLFQPNWPTDPGYRHSSRSET